jgi:hypothetical protein
METIFKKGDKVFCYMFGGWGEVIEEYGANAIHCSFSAGNVYLTKEGRYLHLNSIPPILSFTEYTLEGFSQERPEELPKKGDIVWVRGELPSEWIIGHFLDKINNQYCVCISPNCGGWTHSGVEIRTTNPYEDEN